MHGERAEHICAFARRHGGETVVVAAPRLLAECLGEAGRQPVGYSVWGDTWVELPADELQESWTNVLTDAAVVIKPSRERQGLPLGEVFGRFPYALLHARGPAS